MAFWTSFDDSPHRLQTRTPDGRDLLVCTGTAGFSLKGTGGSWRREDAYHLVGPQWRRVDAVAPIASLGSASNQNEAINAGWAVDNCRWAVFNGRILLIVALAVRDVDGWLQRFNYQLTAIGAL